MAWASEKAALETADAARYVVLEIDLTDPDGILPNTGQWTATRTLYLCDTDLKRTSSGAEWLTKYQEAVTDWGSISAAASMSTAFETTGDVQITLNNAAIQTQEPGSSISGITALNPEPVGEEMRLIEMVRLYNWEGSEVRVKVLTIGSYTTDQASGDVEYQLTTIFTGEIAEVDATHDALVLDITQSDAVERSKLPGREIIDSWDEAADGRRAPLVYGSFDYPARFITDWNPLANTADPVLAIGYLPPCTPAIPWQRYTTNPEKLRTAIWADFQGINSGWTSQPDFGTGTYARPGGDAKDRVILYHSQSNTVTQLIGGTNGPAGNPGTYSWIDDVGGSGSITEGAILINEFLQGFHYAPAETVVESSGVTNPENVVDRNPDTYATIDLTNGSAYLIVRMPVLGRYGAIEAGDNCIVAYVAAQGVSATGTPDVDFGLWRTAGTDSYIGAAGADNVTTAVITGGARGVTYQDNLVLSDYVRQRSSQNDYREPILDWTWEYSDGGTNVGEVLVKIEISAVGTGGTLRVYGAGIRSFYKATSRGQTAVAPRVRGSGRDRARETFLSSKRFNPDSVPLGEDTFGTIFCCPGRSTLDDASGTITGTGELVIEHPIDIAHHLLRAWCQDTTGSDLETSTSTFGTFASTARTRLNRWIGQNVAGGSSNTWKCAWTIANDTTVASALAQLCSEAPMMIQRDPATGKFLCVVYENDTLAGSAQDWEKFLDADDNVVAWHPNYFDERGLRSDAGRPYAVREFGARSGGREGRYTDVRVRFRRFAPTGAFLDSVYANPDGQKVWSVTAGDYVEGASGTLYTQATAAESYLGRRTEEFVLESVTIQDPATATGLLWYLTTVLTGQPVLVRGFTDAEGCVLKPGHVFQVSNDMNLWNPMPYYGGDDWSDHYFYCTRVETSFNGRQPVVYFEGVQWLVI